MPFSFLVINGGDKGNRTLPTSLQGRFASLGTCVPMIQEFKVSTPIGTFYRLATPATLPFILYIICLIPRISFKAVLIQTVGTQLPNFLKVVQCVTLDVAPLILLNELDSSSTELQSVTSLLSRPPIHLARSRGQKAIQP